MKIGIIIHSHTGNTNLVADKLRTKLLADGHSVTLEKLRLAGNWQPGQKEISFTELPNIKDYQGIVFGSPVEAFSLSSVMRAFLSTDLPLADKQVACLITQFFPYPWMGGNRAVGQMKRLCQAQGGKMVGSAIVNWKNARREEQIAEAVENLSKVW